MLDVNKFLAKDNMIGSPILLIIDGLDNTGKTTLINRLTTVLENLLYSYTVIHSEKPPKNIPLDETAEYQHKYYFETLYNLIKELKESRKYKYIILDRGWMSEYVYGSMYRNRDKNEISVDNITLDVKVQQLFRDTISGKINVYTVLLTAPTEFLLNNEDGQSLSSSKFVSIYVNNERIEVTLQHAINTERELFETAYDNTLICNKVRYQVANAYRFLDILPDVCKFINIL